MIFNNKTHYAIYFILGYRYFLKHNDVVKDYSYIPGSEILYEEFRRNNVINLALIPQKKVTENFISRMFSSFDGEPLIEAIYKSKSDYYYISDEHTKIFPLKNYHQQFNLITEEDLEQKLFTIVKFLYESSKLESNDDLYNHFYESIFVYLTAQKVSPYTPEYYHFMDEKKRNLMDAVFQCAGVGGLERHNVLTGMNYLPNSAEIQSHKLIDWGNEYLYKVFRD
jgi:hypothetical protein